MNLDLWMAEYPSDYLLLVTILTEFLLAVISYSLITRRAAAVMDRLRNAMPELGMIRQGEKATRVAIMRNTSALAFSGAAVAFIGWIISFGSLLTMVPETAEEEFVYFTAWRMLSFLGGAFLIQMVFWLPMLYVYRACYIVTFAGIWQSRAPFRDRMSSWNEVRKIRFTLGGLLGYRVYTDRGNIRMRVDMTGFSDFARLAVEHVPASRRPRGKYALERFTQAPAGKIWYVAPWNLGMFKER